MTTTLLNVVLIGVVSLIAFETILYWHRNTQGTWREWPAGRSLMYLLLIIATGFGFGTLNQFAGQYPARVLVSFGLYVLFVIALVSIRLTIRSELRRGKAKAQHPASAPPPTTGTIDITVATDKEASNE